VETRYIASVQDWFSGGCYWASGEVMNHFFTLLVISRFAGRLEKDPPTGIDPLPKSTIFVSRRLNAA
jgi:hypothetical protein